MQTSFNKNIYRHSPVFMQNVFTSIYGWDKNRRRYKNNYHYWSNFFHHTHNWSHETILDFQNEQLVKLIKTAYEKVPFYRERFRESHLTPKDISSVDDLPKLPILEKNKVRDAGAQLQNQDFNRKALYFRATSGSTGSPLLIRSAWNTMEMEFGFVWSRFRHGVTRGEPWALLSGLEIVEPSQTRPPFWRQNWASNERLYSIFHMNEKTLPYYVEDLNSHQFSYFTGYPSAWYIIAEFMHRNNMTLTCPVKAFFSSSETLQPRHKEMIERVFKCKVWNRYGLGELVASITEYSCKHLHYDMDYSVIEFLPIGMENGLLKAEIIGTSLHDTSWPLFRYRTGDICLFDPNEKCDHAPGKVIREIYGRTGHYFTLPNGAKIMNCTSIVRSCKNILNIQVVQRALGSIEVHVVPGQNYSAHDEEELIRQFRNRLGYAIDIEIVHVPHIEKTENGKYLSILNLVDNCTEHHNHQH